MKRISALLATVVFALLLLPASGQAKSAPSRLFNVTFIDQGAGMTLISGQIGSRNKACRIGERRVSARNITRKTQLGSTKSQSSRGVGFFFVHARKKVKTNDRIRLRLAGNGKCGPASLVVKVRFSPAGAG